MKPKHAGGRPPGAQTLQLRSLRLVLGGLQKRGRISGERLLERLYDMALGGDLEAMKLLLAYLYGRPLTRLDLHSTHELGPSATALLLQIAQSDAHRANLERVQAWRDSRALTTSVVESAEDKAAS